MVDLPETLVIVGGGIVWCLYVGWVTKSRVLVGLGSAGLAGVVLALLVADPTRHRTAWVAAAILVWSAGIAIVGLHGETRARMRGAPLSLRVLETAWIFAVILASVILEIVL